MSLFHVRYSFGKFFASVGWFLPRSLSKPQSAAELLLLLPSAVTSSINTSDPVPLAATAAPRLTDDPSVSRGARTADVWQITRFGSDHEALLSTSVVSPFPSVPFLRLNTQKIINIKPWEHLIVPFCASFTSKLLLVKHLLFRSSLYPVLRGCKICDAHKCFALRGQERRGQEEDEPLLQQEGNQRR